MFKHRIYDVNSNMLAFAVVRDAEQLSSPPNKNVIAL